MPTTTQFDEFLFAEYLNDRDEYERLLDLHTAVSRRQGRGETDFPTERAANGVLLVHGKNMTLVLASESARDAFLRHLDSKGDGDLESHAGYMRAISKDD